jgi:hypothetical protein
VRPGVPGSGLSAGSLTRPCCVMNRRSPVVLHRNRPGAGFRVASRISRPGGYSGSAAMPGESRPEAAASGSPAGRPSKVARDLALLESERGLVTVGAAPPGPRERCPAVATNAGSHGSGWASLPPRRRAVRAVQVLGWRSKSFSHRSGAAAYCWGIERSSRVRRGSGSPGHCWSTAPWREVGRLRSGPRDAAPSRRRRHPELTSSRT